MYIEQLDNLKYQ